jgi:hypothetical protein
MGFECKRLFSSVGRQTGYRDFVTSLASETRCWDTAFIEPGPVGDKHWTGSNMA